MVGVYIDEILAHLRHLILNFEILHFILKAIISLLFYSPSSFSWSKEGL